MPIVLKQIVYNELVITNLHFCAYDTKAVSWHVQKIQWYFSQNYSEMIFISKKKAYVNYINPGYGLSLVDTLWNASSYRQPLELEGIPMT